MTGETFGEKRGENHNSRFDVPQHLYLGAELCKLVGLFF